MDACPNHCLRSRQQTCFGKRPSLDPELYRSSVRSIARSGYESRSRIVPSDHMLALGERIHRLADKSKSSSALGKQIQAYRSSLAVFYGACSTKIVLISQSETTIVAVSTLAHRLGHGGNCSTVTYSLYLASLLASETSRDRDISHSLPSIV